MLHERDFSRPRSSGRTIAIARAGVRRLRKPRGHALRCSADASQLRIAPCIWVAWTPVVTTCCSVSHSSAPCCSLPRSGRISSASRSTLAADTGVQPNAACAGPSATQNCHLSPCSDRESFSEPLVLPLAISQRTPDGVALPQDTVQATVCHCRRLPDYRIHAPAGKFGALCARRASPPPRPAVRRHCDCAARVSGSQHAA